MRQLLSPLIAVAAFALMNMIISVVCALPAPDTGDIESELNNYRNTTCTTFGTSLTTYCRFGQVKGQFGEFNCPDGTRVHSISGRAKKYMDAIKVKCTDGTESPLFGGFGGDPFEGGNAPSGILNFVGVRSGKVVEGITYIPDVWYGGRGGKQLGAYNGIGCPLVGFSAYTDTLVNQLTFKFSCEMNVPAVKSGQLYGKDEGDRHEQATFECPPNQRVSGLSVRHADAIYAVQFQCSDGTKSEVIGGTGGVGPDPYTIGEEGIRQLSIRTSERIDALTINRRYLGGYDGTEQPVVNPCENSNGVVVGAYMSWRDSLKSIAFNWVC